MKLIYLLFIFSFSSYCFSQDYTYQDSISSHQTCVAYNSINDGHPGPPGMPFFQSTLGYTFDEGTELNICVANTFAPEGFFRNSLFSLNFLNALYENNSFDFIKSLGASWQQTWLFEKDNVPTFSSIIAVQYPYDEPSDVTELQTTFIMVKNIGNSGVGYLNSFVNIASNSLDSYSFLAGYKFFISETSNLFFDTIYSSDNTFSIGAALEINLPMGSVISPGINYQLDTNNNSNSFGVGLVVLYQTL